MIYLSVDSTLEEGLRDENFVSLMGKMNFTGNLKPFLLERALNCRERHLNEPLKIAVSW